MVLVREDEMASLLRFRKLVLTLAVLCAQPCQGQSVKTDLYGDPLPEGAVARLGTVRLRHSADVIAAALSPDGKLLVSCGGDASIRLWDLADGKQRWIYRTDGSWDTKLAFAPDGTWLAAAVGPVVHRIEVATGQSPGPIVRHSQAIHSLKFAPSAKFLVSSSADILNSGEVRLTEIASHKELFRCPVHRIDPAIALSRDERVIIFDRPEGGIEARRIADGVLVYQAGPGAWSQLAPDGATMLEEVRSGDRAAIVRDVATGKEKYRLKLNSEEMIYFSPVGKSLLVQGFNEATREFDLASGRLLRAHTDSHLYFREMAPNSKSMAYVEIPSPTSDRFKLTLKSRDNGAELLGLRLTAPLDFTDRFKFTTDSRCLAIIRNGDAQFGCGTGVGTWFGASKPAAFEIRDLADGASLVHQEYGSGTKFGSNQMRLEFTPDSARAVTWGSRPAIRAWQIRAGQELTERPGHEDAIRTGAVSVDGASLFSVDEGDGVIVWDSANGRRLKEMPRTGLQVKQLAMSPDGRYLAMLEVKECWVEVVSIWDAQTGRMLARLGRKFEFCHWLPDFPNLHAIAFAPDGTLRVVGTLLTENKGKKLLVWEVDVAKAIARAPAQMKASTLAESIANLVLLDDLTASKSLATAGEKEHVEHLSLFDAGRYMLEQVQEGDRNLVRLYDPASSRRLFELPESAWTKRIIAAAVQPGGKEVVLIGFDGRRKFLEIWDVSTARRRQRIELGTDQTTDVLAFSPDGKLLAVGSALDPLYSPTDTDHQDPIIVQSTIRAWAVETGALVRHIGANSSAIRSLAFSPDGKHLASGTADSTWLIWDLASVPPAPKDRR